MNRPFLFMSGEFRVSMPTVFLREQWSHTMSPDHLIIEDDGRLHRKQYVNETLKGVIHYADVNNKEIEKSNLSKIIEHHIPCWPNPHTLLHLLDRHKVLAECASNGYVSHDIYQFRYAERKLPKLWFPFVAKIGNDHRGIGKHLIYSKADFEQLPEWKGYATFEPFFKGDSVRVLVIDNYTVGIKIENDTSWIKNSAGAETSVIDISETLKDHAMNVVTSLNLEIAGVDYIVEPNGYFHFLEVNQYPGIDVSDEVEDIAKKFLKEKMDLVEEMAVSDGKFEYSNNMYVGP